MAQLPLPDAYRAAVLTPSLCFSDPELKNARVFTNARGLPVVWAGQFATVFRLLMPTKRMAVRCFTSQISDQQERYAKLHNHISGKQAPMLVDFQYQPNGIRVNGVWYPIVKMEWVEGVPLDQKVEECINKRDTATLRSLASQWLQLVIGLQQLKIAHGDLQHENVLVSNGYLRLVDYDGAFVLSLSGKQALELGHPHYQHPLRKSSDFNLALDNFSALVIYLSLKALSVDTSLWSKFHKDKHLLLLADDFKAPQRSQVIADLKHSSDDEVRNLASKLEAACASPLSVVPVLSSIVKTTPVSNWRKSWKGMEAAPLSKTSSQAASAGNWLKSWKGVESSAFFKALPSVSKHEGQWWKKQNVWAWGAIVLALLAILPALHFLAGLAAVVCGFIGRSVAHRFAKRGKPMASGAIGLGALMVILSLPMPDIGSWLRGWRKEAVASYDIPAIKAHITSFRLYESGEKQLPYNKRDYGHVFTKSKTRYVNWEANLEHPTPPRRIDFTLTAIWYRGDGNIITQQTFPTYVEAGWSNSYHDDHWGANKLGGYWQKGSYRIELYVDGKKVAEDSFVVR